MPLFLPCEGKGVRSSFPSMPESEFYTADELRSWVGSVGENVLIDRTVRMFHPKALHFGSHVRIDSYCILQGGKGIHIGNHVHLAPGCQLAASGAPVVVEDFVGLSSRVNIFTATDDYSGGALTNPTVPEEFRAVSVGPVTLRKHVIVGAGSVIMQGLTVGVGAAIGALSFINKDIPEWAVVSGNPPRLVGRRDSVRLLALEEKFRDAHRR